MNRFRTFESFSGKSEADSEVLAEIMQKTVELPYEKVEKAKVEAKNLAGEFGMKVEDLEDPKVAAELLLRAFAKKPTEITENEMIDEGLGDFFSSIVPTVKKFFAGLGSYAGIAGTIVSLIGVGGTLGMSKAAVPDWYWKLAEEIFPNSGDWSFIRWKLTMTALFFASTCVSCIVGIYSVGKKAKYHDEDNYRNF